MTVPTAGGTSSVAGTGNTAGSNAAAGSGGANAAGAGGTGDLGGAGGSGGTAGSGGLGGMGGTTPGGTGGAPPVPVEEITWSHTDCDFDALDFPNIDKNEGAFPPGSCPPPEDIYRACGGDTKIQVMTSSASTYESGYWHPPEYAHDEYMMTRWSSHYSDSQWLDLDLGTTQTFTRMYLVWELAHGGDYDIQVSDDGQDWQTVKEVRGGNGYQDIVDLEGTGRYIRINGVARGTTDTGGELYGYSLFDVTICGQRP